MKSNPVNETKSTMWKFLMDGGQKSNIPALKEYVYDLIGMTTQKNAGQKPYASKNDINWDNLDMTLMSIAIEATALVLSGDLEKNRWIPITEQLPRQGAYVLLSFENYKLPDIGFYEEDKEGGAFCNSEGYRCNSAGIYVNAWMPLPQPYRSELE